LKKFYKFCIIKGIKKKGIKKEMEIAIGLIITGLTIQAAINKKEKEFAGLCLILGIFLLLNL
jgi:hypothetical protein